MLELQKFVGWLSFHPPAEYVARSSVVEHLAASEVLVCRISQLCPDDSLQVLSSFGPDAEEQGHIESGIAWRRWCQENLITPGGHEVGSWNLDGTQLVLPLRDRGGIQGFIHFVFAQESSDSKKDELLAKTSAFATAHFNSILPMGTLFLMVSSLPISLLICFSIICLFLQPLTVAIRFSIPALAVNR